MNAESISSVPVGNATRKSDRAVYLDWLRVMAFSAVFLYHSSRFFDADDWEIKSAQTSSLITVLKGIFDLWGMPLIFLISGAAIYFALRPGGAARFLRDRVSRLLVPMALGILVLAPPQVYLQRLTHGLFQGSFLEFLPLYFRDWNIWGGNFAWSGVHLWYLENLFLYTLVLLPLFAFLKSPAGGRFIQRLGILSARPGAIYLWALPLALSLILIDPEQMAWGALAEDLTRLLVFWPFLIYGFLVFGDLRIQQAIMAQRRVSLGLAMGLLLIVFATKEALQQVASLWAFLLMMAVAGILIWSILLAVLGYGIRYLTRSNRLLAYANEAVLPFYILHQPVILIIGYFVLPLPLPILAKYLLIASTAFGITISLYEFGIRRINPVRRIFGLKPRTIQRPVVVPAPAI